MTTPRVYPNSEHALGRRALCIYTVDRRLSDERQIALREVYSDLRCAALLAVDEGRKVIAREHAHHARMLIRAFGVRIERRAPNRALAGAVA